MDRAEFMQYAADNYGAEPEYPWMAHTNFAVFRHSSNRKWFALVMDVPRNKLGLPGETALDVVNLKCSPALIGSLRDEPGVFPAYHMNKGNWVSVALDGSTSDDVLRLLLDVSYDATKPKPRKKR